MSSLLTMGAKVTVNIGDFCSEASPILQFVGYILTFFKIAIPLVIIAYGMFDLGKAVVASKDDEIKTQTKRLLYRALAGIFIFFVPTLVLWLFGAIGGYETEKEKVGFEKCQTCVLEPWNCK